MRAGWFSQLWFAYLNPMLAKGATEPLQFPDVFSLPAEQESTGIHVVFDAAWKHQLSLHGEAGASIWAAIYAAAGWRFWSSGALLLVATVASLAESFALENLLAALDSEDISESVAWAAVLVCLGTVYVFTNQHMAMQGMEMGMRGRTALTAALHAKLLRVPSGVSRGLVSTLVGTDAAKMTDLGWDFHYIWASPITLLVALAMCWRLLGPAILPAVGVAVILIPVNAAITAAFTETENDIMAHRQRRMASISEAAGSILGVKLFGWEGRVARRIARHRIRELRHVRRFSLGVASVMSVVLSMSTLMACAAFGTYSLTGGTLTSSVVFPALYLIQLTAWPLLQLPYVLSALGAACASMSRIRRFLLGKEVTAASRADTLGKPALIGGRAMGISAPATASAAGAASYAAAVAAPAPPPAGATDDVIVLERATLRWPRPSRVSRKRGQEAAGAGGDDPSCLTLALRNSWFRGRPDVVPATSADVDVAEPLLEAADMSADADAAVAAAGKGARPRKPVLHDLTLRVPRGQLVAVIGPVGSGKSSLLAAVLGELEAADGTPRRSGRVGVRGRVALVPQSSWVRSSTVRANVSMAAPLCRPDHLDGERDGHGHAIGHGDGHGHAIGHGDGDGALALGCETAEEAERAYGEVLDACCLRPDLELLAHGEATEVGESGVSLSGGQKARVTLARAVRSGLEVALLDDPLSAVDAHVGARLFHDVVCGALRGCTRLLVTHQLQFLPQVDRILVMKDGRIAHDGTYEELLADGVKFSSLLEQVAEEQGGAEAEVRAEDEDEDEDEDEATAALGRPPMAAAAGASSAGGSVGGPAGHPKGKAAAAAAAAAAGSAEHMGAGVTLGALRVPRLSREGSHSSLPWSPKRVLGRNPGGETPSGDAPAAGGSLVSDEDRSSGTVGSAVFMAYGASLGGIGFALWFVFLSLGLELASTGGSAFLALWADAADGKATSPPPFATDVNPPAAYWVSIYFTLGLVSTVASLFRNFAWFEATFRASRRLHDRVVSALLRAPLSFWTSTPSGRILNRLSKDVGVVDQELPDYSSDVLLCVVECVARLTTIAVASPIFLVVFVPVGVFYYIVTKFYRGSSRELKRLEAIASSPLQARFAETVEGLPSIRAFGLQDSERKAAAAALDNSNTLFWVSSMANRWISVRVEFSGSVIVAAVAAIAVITTIPAVQPFVPGVRSLLALALTYSINLTGTLNWLVRSVTTAEAEFSRVERLYHFASIAPEAPLDGKAPAAVLAGSAPGPAVAAGSCDVSDAAVMLGPPGAPTVAHASSTGTMASEALVEAAALIVGGKDADRWEGTEEFRRQRRSAEEVQRPPAGWPSRGQLVFRDVWMRYRPDLAPVLRGVTVQIEAGTRVGIVGRTGAGKSSLFGALFRTVELCRGGIVLDGVDTSSVGLRAVRAAIAAVPQDPVLWSGTLRSALDPSGPDEDARGSAGGKDSDGKARGSKAADEDDEDDDDEDEDDECEALDHGDDEEGHEDGGEVDCLTRCVCGDPHRPITEAEVRSGMRWDEMRGMPAAPPPTDEELLGSLEAVGLGEWARTFTLEGRLEEGGRNLSLGTRQLLALARTLLRRSAVIALDEATASVSPAEDNAIQLALQTAFRGRTVLAVAHRLPTVIGYDRILVMDAGRLCEWGSPAQLLSIPGANTAAGAQRAPLVTGLFASMVAETGAPSEAALRAAATTAAGL